MRALALVGTIVGSVALFSGCMEETSPQQSQSQPGPTAPAAPEKQGPITSMAGQGGGSALGGAKRAAGNIASQAEEASKKTAGEAGGATDDE